MAAFIYEVVRGFHPNITWVIGRGPRGKPVFRVKAGSRRVEVAL